MSHLEPIIHLQAVTKRYRSSSGDPGFALAPTSMEVHRGTWSVVTGRSGAGKTTLLQLLAGLDRPDTGMVSMFGRDITNDSESALSRIRRQRLGIVYQQFHFIEHLPVWQNVTCRLIPEGLGARRRRERAREILGQLGLAGMEDRRPAALSGGEQQRIAVARAVIDRPDVVIADEPTSNTDADTAEMIVVCFKQMQDQGAAIVITTHDPALVSLADHHYVMEGGALAR